MLCMRIFGFVIRAIVYNIIFPLTKFEEDISLHGVVISETLGYCKDKNKINTRSMAIKHSPGTNKAIIVQLFAQ